MNLKEMRAFGDDSMRLRPIERADIDMLRLWRNRDDARKWFKDTQRVEAAQQLRWYDRYLSRSDDIMFAVTSNSVSVGFVAIYDADEATQSAEIGRFLVCPDHQGQGHMFHACRLVIQTCREVLALSYLRLSVHNENIRAIALYRRHGFIEVAAMDSGFSAMQLKLAPTR